MEIFRLLTYLYLLTYLLTYLPTYLLTYLLAYLLTLKKIQNSKNKLIVCMEIFKGK